MLIVILSLSNKNTESDKVMLGIDTQFKEKLLDDIKARILLQDKILRCTECIFSWHETIIFLVENKT